MAKEEPGLLGSRRGLEDKRTLLVDLRRCGAPLGYFFRYMLSTFGGYYPEDLGVISWAQDGVADWAFSPLLGQPLSYARGGSCDLGMDELVVGWGPATASSNEKVEI